MNQTKVGHMTETTEIAAITPENEIFVDMALDLVPGVDMIPMPQWIETGERIDALDKNLPWWHGDWLNFGMATYGEEYAQGINLGTVGSEAIQTKMTRALVADRIPKPHRRPDVDWSHHRSIAYAFEDDLNEIDRWLEDCALNGWTVKELDIEIKKHKGILVEATAEEVEEDLDPENRDYQPYSLYAGFFKKDRKAGMEIMEKTRDYLEGLASAAEIELAKEARVRET